MSKLNIFVPTPYPRKQTDINTNSNYNQISEINNLRKQLSDLENKYNNLLKLFNKNEKKSKEKNNELKRVKTDNENFNNDYIILQKTLQKISLEKNILEKEIENNKKYINKLEQKLLSGAKNQFLIEQNNQLKDKLDKLQNELNIYLNEIKNLKQIKNKQEKDLKVLNRALDLKITEIKKENNISKEEIINISSQKEEFELYNREINKLKKENEKLKENLDLLGKKLEELNYEKNKLSEMMILKENLFDNLNNEKENLKSAVNQITKERDMLKQLIETAHIEQKKIEKDVLFEATENNNKISSLELEIKDLTQQLNQSKIENEMLNKSLNILNEKYQKIDSDYKLNIEELTKVKSEIEGFKQKNSTNENINDQLNYTNEELNKKNNELNEQIHQIEKQNIDLLSKIQLITVDKNNIQNDLVKQNMDLCQQISRLKEQINNYIKENEILKEERDKYKKIMIEMTEHSNNLLKDDNLKIQKEIISTLSSNKSKSNINSNNNTLTDINNKIISQKEENDYNLKNKNENLSFDDYNLHKTNNNILQKIRYEKEKYKNILEDIKKIKYKHNIAALSLHRFHGFNCFSRLRPAGYTPAPPFTRTDSL